MSGVVLTIPESEFINRMKRPKLLVKAAGLDAFLVNRNEADFASVRYFSDR